MQVLKIKYDVVTGANVVSVEVPSTTTSRNNQRTQKLPRAPYIKVTGVHTKKQHSQKSQINTNRTTNQIATTAQTDVVGSQTYQSTQEKQNQIRIRRDKERAIQQERNRRRQFKAVLPKINAEQKLPIVVLELSSTSNFAKACASCYDDQQKQRFYECARALYPNGK